MSRLLKEAWLLARYGIFYSAVSNAIFIFFLAVYLITVFPGSPCYLPVMAGLCIGSVIAGVYWGMFVCAGEVFARPSLNCIFQVQKSLAVIKIVVATISTILLWPMSQVVGQLFGWVDDLQGLQGARLFLREWLTLLLLGNLYASRCVGGSNLSVGVLWFCVFIFGGSWRDASLMFDLGLVLINGFIFVVDLQVIKGPGTQRIRINFSSWHSIAVVVGNVLRRIYGPSIVECKGPLVLLPPMLKFAPWFAMLIAAIAVFIFSYEVLWPAKGVWGEITGEFSGYGVGLSFLVVTTGHIYVQSLRSTKFALIFGFFENRHDLFAALERRTFWQIVQANFILVAALYLIPLSFGSHNSLLAPALLFVPLLQLFLFYALFDCTRINLAIWQMVLGLVFGHLFLTALFLLDGASQWPWIVAALCVPLIGLARHKYYARWHTCNLAFACRLPLEDPLSIGGRYASSV